MKNIQNLIAGFAGALSLTLLHEGLKKQLDDAPRIDLLGEEAVNVIMDKAGKPIHDDKKLYATTLAGDLLANTLYYSAIGAGGKYTWTKAITLGLSAGLGAVKLARPLGLNEKTVARNDKVKVLTVLYYLSGALVTAGVIKALKR
ncbi:hypothetical protein [Pedobacter sp. Leaf176]|uniref:hypothetical protein n=1 Tax=Pedobacter sp. Leaf176 TaxID=1736286 RepID=UPI0006FAC74C|nr:hypothetical protein [Pedobacter sp. Leaf176]KQR71466.1 hypothetical protein ASF92_05760 [Pedobacter sp. Leaf176]